MMVSPILGPKERTLGLSVSSLWLLIQLATLNRPLDVQAFDFRHGGGSWTLAATDTELRTTGVLHRWWISAAQAGWSL